MNKNSSQNLLSKLEADKQGFKLLTEYLYSLCGIHLPENDKNLSLLASRLVIIFKEKRLNSYIEYYNYLIKSGPAAHADFISALTTNTTQFFREQKHFEILSDNIKSIMQEKLKSGSVELRIWCAAASTGQEPITILISLLEAAPSLLQWNIKFLATDIDFEVLKTAADGKYSESDLFSLPVKYKTKYFELISSENSEKTYRFSSKYNHLITYAHLNLLSEPYPFKHKFDIVFCRNVLIYFDHATVQNVLGKIVRSMNENGLLFLGHSESGLMKNPNIKSVATSVYLKHTAAKLQNKKSA